MHTELDTKAFLLRQDEIEKMLEDAAEMGAKKVVAELQENVYKSVGKTVVEKGLAAIGVAAIGVAFLFQNGLWPFHR